MNQEKPKPGTEGSLDRVRMWIDKEELQEGRDFEVDYKTGVVKMLHEMPQGTGCEIPWSVFSKMPRS